jgi:hypothetical protein
VRFRVLDAERHPVRAFDLEHERLMHAIVVRRDLTGFQHLHPTMAADGTWSMPLRVAEPGAYRLFADFSTGGERRVLGIDLDVPGAYAPRPLPAPTAVASVDGYTVSAPRQPGSGGRHLHVAHRAKRAGRDTRSVSRCARPPRRAA